MQLSPRDTETNRLIPLVALVVVALVIMTVWFRESETGPIHRARTAVHALARPAEASGRFVTTPFRAVQQWAAGLGISRSEVAALKLQNAQLRARVEVLQEADLENARLRALLDLAKASQYKMKAARVIGRSQNPYEQTVTLGSGTADGIKAGMPVVAARGLLGQVVDASARTATVRLVVDRRSGVAAMVQRSRAEGIVRGSIDGALTLEMVSSATTLTVGDVLITSGLGGVYPKGLVIGEINRVTSSPTALFGSATLASPIRVDGLEEVLVITDAPSGAGVGSVTR